MDLEIIILSEVSQTKKDKYRMTSLIGGILKNDTNELIYKTETDKIHGELYTKLTDKENKLMVTKGERWVGGIN